MVKSITKEKARKLKQLAKQLSKQVKSKRTSKKSKVSLHIKQTGVPRVLGDPNRFFKDEMEEAKHALFFR